MTAQLRSMVVPGVMGQPSVRRVVTLCVQQYMASGAHGPSGPAVVRTVFSSDGGPALILHLPMVVSTARVS